MQCIKGGKRLPHDACRLPAIKNMGQFLQKIIQFVNIALSLGFGKMCNEPFAQWILISGKQQYRCSRFEPFMKLASQSATLPKLVVSFGMGMFACSST